jgi:exodeoxyribonuclease VII small subunit
MPKAPAAPAVPDSLTYEAALQELEGLVARVESGQLPLDELLAGYQRGAVLLKICRDKLQAVEQQIKVLDGKGDGAAGMETKPWTQE